MSKSKRRMKPASSQVHNFPKGVPVPPPEDRIKLTEVQFLKFRLTKMSEEILRLQEMKLDADKEVLRLTEENLNLRKQITIGETAKIYDECGIKTGDQVVQRDGEFMIIRRMGQIPGMPGQAPPPPPPPPPAPSPSVPVPPPAPPAPEPETPPEESGEQK